MRERRVWIGSIAVGKQGSSFGGGHGGKRREDLLGSETTVMREAVLACPWHHGHVCLADRVYDLVDFPSRFPPSGTSLKSDLLATKN
jgi:hypothetical protein